MCPPDDLLSYPQRIDRLLNRYITSWQHKRPLTRSTKLQMSSPLALSTPTAHLLSLLFSLTYVGSLYISKHSRLSFSTTTNNQSNKGEWQNGNNQGEREREKEQSERWRDDPDVIRARLLAVLCATTVCCSVFAGFIWAGLGYRWEVRDSPPLSLLPLLTPYKDAPNSPHASAPPPRLLRAHPLSKPTPPAPDNTNPLPRTHLLRLPRRSTPLSEELDLGEPCYEEVLYLGGGAELCRCECWMFRFRFLPFHLLSFSSFYFDLTDANINEKNSGPNNRRNSLQSMYIIRIPPLRRVESQDDLFGAVVFWVG